MLEMLLNSKKSVNPGSWERLYITGISERSSPGITSYNDLLYIHGGDRGYTAPLADLYSVNPTTLQVSPLTSYSLTGTGIAFNSLSDGPYRTGGGSAGTYHNANARYNVLTNNWTNRKSVPVTIDLMGSVVVNNALYLVGGRIKNTLYRYTPDNDTWVSLASLPSARFIPAVCSDGEHIYVYGGSTSTTLASYTNTLLKYSIISNTWSTVGNFATRRRASTCYYFNNRVYVIGGYDAESSIYSDDYFYIDLSTLQIVYLDPFPIQVSNAGLCRLNNSIYHFGGSTPAGLSNALFKLEL